MKTILLALMLVTVGLLPAPAAADCPPDGWLGGAAVEQQACAAILAGEGAGDEVIRVLIAALTGQCTANPANCVPDTSGAVALVDGLVQLLLDLADFVLGVADELAGLILDFVLAVIDPLVVFIVDLADALAAATLLLANTILQALCTFAGEDDCPQLPP